MTAAQLGLSDSQYRNALGIIAAVRKRGWEPKAAVIAIETALTESGMRMIASANVPESQKYPHELLSWTSDGLGHDHASMGMFQQQTGTRWTTAGFGDGMNQTTMNSSDGWGTPAELMDAEKSTTKFLDALGRVDWQHMDNWVAAQAVQRSAFPDGSNYRNADAVAQRIVSALWNTSATSASGDDMGLRLQRYPSDKTITKHDAIYLVTLVGDLGVQQQWMPSASVLADRQQRMRDAGIADAEVHDSQHSRDYYGPVVGPDPEHFS